MPSPNTTPDLKSEITHLKATAAAPAAPAAAGAAAPPPHTFLSKMGQQVKYLCKTDKPVRVRRDIIEDVDIPTDPGTKPSVFIGGRWLFTEVLEEVTDAAIPHVPYGTLTEDEMRDAHEARRDGRTRPGTTERRERHARGIPIEHGANAAGPNEFAVSR